MLHKYTYHQYNYSHVFTIDGLISAGISTPKTINFPMKHGA